MKTKSLNEQEVAVLFDQFYKDLKRYVLNFTDSIECAEDSAQLSFAKLLKKKPAFEDSECAKHWLKKVARNCLFTFHKKNKRYIFVDPQENQSEIKNLNPMLDTASGFEVLASSEEEVSSK